MWLIRKGFKCQIFNGLYWSLFDQLSARYISILNAVEEFRLFCWKYPFPKHLDCDLFARVVPAKGNRVVAKPYVISIAQSKSKQIFPSITAKPIIRTIATSTTMKPTKPAKPPISVIQTKVNDFFKKNKSGISSHNHTPTAQPNLNTSLERTSQHTLKSPGNLNPPNEQMSSTRILNSNGRSQTLFMKPQNSPKLLSSRSQLYDFGESFMSTQVSIGNGKENNTDPNSLNIAVHQEYHPRLEPDTPISLKLFNAKSTGNEFVSAKSIFTGATSGISLSVEECDDDLFESSFSFTQNDQPKNIIACIETAANGLPNHNKCLEQSIANILNCKVKPLNMNRNYRNEFEEESLFCVSNDAKHATALHVRPKETQPAIQKENFCDTFYSNDSTECAFSQILANTTRPIDSPMLERKKQKQNHNLDFNFNVSDTNANDCNDMSKTTNESNPLLLTNNHRQEELSSDGDWERDLNHVPTQNPSMFRRLSNKSVTTPSFDEKRRNSRNSETFWSKEDDSPGTSTDRKISIIDELIANRSGRDKNDAKSQMKKPNGKMIQARIKRTSHTSTSSEVLNRSWDPSYVDQNYSKEYHNREYVRRNILRLPIENTATNSKNHVDDADEAITFDWFSDWCLGWKWKKSKRLPNVHSNKYDYYSYCFVYIK